MVNSVDILNARIPVVDDQEADVRLLERMLRGVGYRNRLAGVRSRYDTECNHRHLAGACYAGGITSFPYSRGVRVSDYAL